MMEKKRHACHVPVLKMQERGVKGIVEADGEAHLPSLPVLGARAEDEGGESGAEGHGIEQRDGHRHCHCQSELCIERARRAAHEAHGDEHRHEDNGSGQQCRRQTAHGIHRSLIGRGISLLKPGLHRLHHHDAVIHDSADDKHKGKESQEVKAEPYDIEEGKGTDERHDDGQGRDERGTQVVEKEPDHQHYQKDCHNQSLHDVGDGGIEEVLRARHVGQHHPLGQ